MSGTLKNLTLKIWRQSGPNDAGRFDTHVIDEITDEASFLEMLDKMQYADGTLIVQNESVVSDRKKIVVLGSGPNRIGQGIEFDYCCVHGVLAAAEAGYETIMINCNPETVSTDFDTADKLYFEPIFWVLDEENLDF